MSRKVIVLTKADACGTERKVLDDSPAGWAEVKADEVETKALITPLVKGVLMGKKARRGIGYRYRCRTCFGSNLSVNSGLGKYIQFINGGTAIGGNNVGSTAEWSSLNSLFDEFFIHSIGFHYQPLNKFSSNTSASGSAAGSPGFANNCGIVAVALQHDQVAYTDASTVASQMMNNLSARWLNTAETWTFTWRNNEKFDPNGVVGDQSTAASTQSWCNVSNTSKYGGFVQFGTPIPSAAAAAVNALLQSGLWGHVIVMFDVSFRMRS